MSRAPLDFSDSYVTLIAVGAVANSERLTHPPVWRSCPLNQTSNSVDDARVLPRFRSAAVDGLEMRREQGLVLLAMLDESPLAVAPARVHSSKAEPGDLRGIPVIGVGVGGVSPGSSPGSPASLARADRDLERRKPLVGYA